MNKYTQTALRLAVAAAGLAVVGQGFAGDGSYCLDDGVTDNAFAVGSAHDSPAVAKQQASNTWNDWVWRGPKYFCTATGTLTCTYHWLYSHQEGYEWAAGLSISGGGVPIIGGILKAFDASGSYTRINYWTETFGWDQEIARHYFAQPVQVVVRRWTSGDFKGVNYNTGNYCRMKADYADGHKYWWNPNGRFGYWGANLEKDRYAMYHVWQE